MSSRVRVAIEGMHCDNCEVTVGAALERAGLDDVDLVVTRWFRHE